MSDVRAFLDPSDAVPLSLEPPAPDEDVPKEIAQLLLRAPGETKLLGVATPINAAEERARLIAALEAGRAEAPRWSYAPMADADARRRALDEAARLLEARATPLARAYAERARELAHEAELASAVGTHGFAERARARFSHGSPSNAAAASELARQWSDEAVPASPASSEGAATIASDAADPRSLLSRMRAAVGRARIPFRVLVQPSLAPLAATGERTIWVTAGRPVTDEEVARTVLHEIEAHALPRARAASLHPSLFAVGTARGADDQEGLALVLEERHGFLRGARRRELSIRHRVAERMDAGATFVEITRALVSEGLSPRRSILVAERAFRGGTADRGGLGRERVYLPCFLRVSAHLKAHPEDERVLSSGQVALDAIPLLSPALY